MTKNFSSELYNDVKLSLAHGLSSIDNIKIVDKALSNVLALVEMLRDIEDKNLQIELFKDIIESYDAKIYDFSLMKDEFIGSVYYPYAYVLKYDSYKKSANFSLGYDKNSGMYRIGWENTDLPNCFEIFKCGSTHKAYNTFTGSDVLWVLKRLISLIR